MFGSIGFLEMAVIAGVALMVLGPEKFPEYAKIAMRGFRDVRKYMTEAQQEISKELNPLKDEFNDLTKMNPESYLEDMLKEEEEFDDDTQENVEPHPDDIDWMSDPYGSSSTEASTQEDGEVGAEQHSTEEPVQHNLYGAETEGADPVGTDTVDPEQTDDFDLAADFSTKKETGALEEEKPLDG